MLIVMFSFPSVSFDKISSFDKKNVRIDFGGKYIICCCVVSFEDAHVACFLIFSCAAVKAYQAANDAVHFAGHDRMNQGCAHVRSLANHTSFCISFTIVIT